jgi:hypothetical protein
VKFMKEGWTLSNGAFTADVEFRSLDDPVAEVPDPVLLEIHAAFARVLHLSGASEYLAKLESRAAADKASVRSDELDLVTLSAKLELISFGAATVAKTPHS